MENTSRPIVLITVGVCGLLSAAILLKRFSGSESEESRAAERLAGLVSERANEEGGWAARDSSQDGGVPRPGGRTGSTAPGAAARPGQQGSSERAGGAAALAGGSARRSAGGVTGAGRDLTVPGALAPGATGEANRGTVAEALARQSRQARERVAESSRALVADAEKAQGENGDPELPVFATFKDGSLESETGVSPLAATDVESKDGQAIFGRESQYVVPNAGNVQGTSGAISFWVTPEWEGSEKDDAHMVDLQTPNVWENRLAINKNGRYLRFMFFPDSGQEAGISTIIDNWQPQQQHHVVAQWGEQDGQNVLEFYVDGRLVGSDRYEGQFQVPQAQSMVIGNNISGNLGARGGISGFEVYPSRLGNDKIGTIYSSAGRY